MTYVFISTSFVLMLREAILYVAVGGVLLQFRLVTLANGICVRISVDRKISNIRFDYLNSDFLNIRII